MKATSFLKSKRLLGMCVCSALCMMPSYSWHGCSPGFFSRLKEKGAMAKDAWGVIGSA